MASGCRTGIGFDAHRFAEGRPLVLGGVTIPHPRGLAGHSDADVLYHAIGDAILGALGRGDLGRHFPDTDARWRSVSSEIIMASIAAMMAAAGWRAVNVDTVIIAQEPKLALHMPLMASNIGRLLSIDAGVVGVKATTTEQMGFTGRGEGIAAMAVVLLEEARATHGG